ncbi:MAG: hypothetical protein II995_02680 [Oscillospiraceae bacterium]|nr:hypothetical protein [Oscillospiraceae bacterium]
MKKQRWVIAAVLAAAALTASFGIGLKMKSKLSPSEPEEDGGVKDSTDLSAPKVINSQEITAFYTSFFCEDAKTPARTGGYWFEIGKNSSGTLMLTASCSKKGGIAADEALLKKVQCIIEQYELVKLNGLNCVTQALPVQYSPCSLSVSYSSGEQLYFRTDGEPDTQWYKDFLDLFLPLFEQD